MVFPTTSGALARTLGAEVFGSADAVVREVANLEFAGPEAITFIRDAKFAKMWSASKAGTGIIAAAAVTEECRLATTSGRALLIVPDADMALIQLLGMLDARPEPRLAGIHPSAVIDASAKVDPTAHIGPHCVIGPESTIGRAVILRERVSIGSNCHIGDGCELYPNVVLYPRTVVGKNVVLHASVIVGSDGFGYRPSPTGLVKIPHIGNVVIGDNVEIGANSCIDRSKFGSTLIGDGTKIDNLVQIGHGVIIGRSVILCAHVGLSGSVRVEDGAMLGGMVGVVDGRVIGKGAMIGGQSAVADDIPAGQRSFGTPAVPIRRAIAEKAFVSKLFDFRAKLYQLLNADDKPPAS